MQSSGISSRATPSTSRSSAEPARKRFSLRGRSIPVDIRTEAARPDLADIRLADRVFAPHYAAPLPRIVGSATLLRSASGMESEALAALEPGDVFEVLEFAGHSAWGVAPGRKLVGYVDADALCEN